MHILLKYTEFCFRDHVKWTEEERQIACQKAEENSCVKIPLEEQGKQHFFELHDKKIKEKHNFKIDSDYPHRYI